LELEKGRGFKSGYVGIIGKPNVGKSTFMNSVLNFKLAAVSPKPQTTRHKILGILTGRNYQILFLDTPGIMDRPKHELDRWMVRRAMEALEEADLILMMTEPYPPEDIDIHIVEEIKEREKPAILAINKVDLVRKPELLPIIDEYSKLYEFKEIIPVSILKAINFDELLKAIIEYLPEGEPFYPEDMITDRPERFVVQEILREKVFQFYGEEIPYTTAVEIEEFIEKSEKHGGKDYIRATIHVERPSQKAIIIGKGGQAIKRLGIHARREIELFLGRPVHLELWVKVSEKWRKNLRFIREIGY